MRFETANIDSLLGRARRVQYRYEAQAAQLNGLLELALDAESSGRPVPVRSFAGCRRLWKPGRKSLADQVFF
jgi:hypothetical protein